jgi:hypothetical protein
MLNRHRLTLGKIPNKMAPNKEFPLPCCKFPVAFSQLISREKTPCGVGERGRVIPVLMSKFGAEERGGPIYSVGRPYLGLKRLPPLAILLPTEPHSAVAEVGGGDYDTSSGGGGGGVPLQKTYNKAGLSLQMGVF